MAYFLRPIIEPLIDFCNLHNISGLWVVLLLGLIPIVLVYIIKGKEELPKGLKIIVIVAAISAIISQIVMIISNR